MANNEWKPGTMMGLPTHVLAEGLKGHKFLIQIAGPDGKPVEQLVEATGGFDDHSGLEVKAVPRDATH